MALIQYDDIHGHTHVISDCFSSTPQFCFWHNPKTNEAQVLYNDHTVDITEEQLITLMHQIDPVLYDDK